MLWLLLFSQLVTMVQLIISFQSLLQTQVFSDLWVGFVGGALESNVDYWVNHLTLLLIGLI